MDVVLKWPKNTPNRILDRIPQGFVHCDRTLRPVLEEVIKKDKFTKLKYERACREMLARGALMTSRRILWMLYNSVSSETNMIGVYGMRKLTDLKWKGDDKIEQFWHEFVTTREEMTFPLPDPTVRDLLYTEMRKSTKVKLKQEYHALFFRY